MEDYQFDGIENFRVLSPTPRHSPEDGVAFFYSILYSLVMRYLKWCGAVLICLFSNSKDLLKGIKEQLFTLAR